MRYSQRRSRQIQIIDLTAMVDFIFQLLLFFMVTSVLVMSHTEAPDVAPPGAGSVLERPLTVVIYSDTEVAVGDAAAIIPLAELDARFQAVAAGDPERSYDVTIEGNRRIAYETFVRVLEVCRSHGYENVTMATK